jgi:hypothetical protein
MLEGCWAGMASESSEIRRKRTFYRSYLSPKHGDGYRSYIQCEPNVYLKLTNQIGDDFP